VFGYVSLGGCQAKSLYLTYLNIEKLLQIKFAKKFAESK
jgi:hypothetical protein